MAFQLRLILFAASLLTVVFVLKEIRKSQMQIKDSIWWIFMSAVILILSIFPQIAIGAAKFLGVESPANLVYLVIIFILILIVFNLSIKISKLNYKFSILVEELAIREIMKEKENG